tara:strand:- start:22445 stop:22849 length:405 start_codon:yes stop_codon:yes gene_type:complete
MKNAPKTDNLVIETESQKAISELGVTTNNKNDTHKGESHIMKLTMKQARAIAQNQVGDQINTMTNEEIAVHVTNETGLDVSTPRTNKMDNAPQPIKDAWEAFQAALTPELMDKWNETLEALGTSVTEVQPNCKK